MSIAETVATEGFEIAESVMDLLLACETPWDWCRVLVHHSFSGEHARGAQIYSLNNNAQFGLVASYGENYLDAGQEVTLWDDNAFADCLKSKTFAFKPATETGGKALVCVPVIHDGMPLGCLSLVLGSDADGLPFDEAWVPVMGRIGAFYLLNAGRGAVAGSRGSSNRGAETPEDLTSRQLEILAHMAEGLVNAEIAKQLLVSESTVRQETVRIYRALAVPNRLEAAKKGRALGLIARRVPVPIGAE